MNADQPSHIFVVLLDRKGFSKYLVLSREAVLPRIILPTVIDGLRRDYVFLYVEAREGVVIYHEGAEQRPLVELPRN